MSRVEPILEVENLRVSIPVPSGELRVNRGVSYTVAPGETFAIVGESGCGKSLGALALMGLQPRHAHVTADRCRFEGRDLLGLNRRELAKIRGERIAVIFQDPMTSLNPVLTIGEQLTEVYRAHGLGTRAEAKARAVDLLERVGIRNAAGRLNQYPHQLSGGLRQRVMIAMAMMCEPKLIIADEPTTALDVTVQALILGLLKELQREYGMALIIISHDLGVVASVADRVAVMYAGQFVEEGDVASIYAAPRHPYTQGLVACIPSSAARGGVLPTIPGTVPALFGELRGCAFRNRCPLAESRCLGGDIALTGGPSHRYRCVHPANVLDDVWQRGKLGRRLAKEAEES